MSCGKKSLTQHMPSLGPHVVSGFEPRPWTNIMLEFYFSSNPFEALGRANLLDPMSACVRAKIVCSDKTESTLRRLFGS
jgi:hypothetical protein